MIKKLAQTITDFVNRIYSGDPEIIEQTSLYLAAGDYESLVAFMEKIDGDHRRNAGVLHFEVLGMSHQLNAEALAKQNLEAAMSSYDKALAAYERGMHFATGSGEGWHFRDLYDRAERRRRRLAKRHGV